MRPSSPQFKGTVIVEVCQTLTHTWLHHCSGFIIYPIFAHYKCTWFCFLILNVCSFLYTWFHVYLLVWFSWKTLPSSVTFQYHKAHICPNTSRWWLGDSNQCGQEEIWNQCHVPSGLDPALVCSLSPHLEMFMDIEMFFKVVKLCGLD